MGSGIRTGTPALTTRGLSADEFRQVANLVADTLESQGDETRLAGIADQVRELADSHPLFDERWMPKTLLPEFARFATDG